MEAPAPSLALRRAVLGRIDEPTALERLKAFFTCRGWCRLRVWRPQRQSRSWW